MIDPGQKSRANSIRNGVITSILIGKNHNACRKARASDLKERALDPNATLNDAETAIHDHNADEAFELLTVYAHWRNNQGFEPPNGDTRFRQLIEEYELDFGAYTGTLLDKEQV